jgi:hypothetical protein
MPYGEMVSKMELSREKIVAAVVDTVEEGILESLPKDMTDSQKNEALVQNRPGLVSIAGMIADKLGF